MVPWPWMDRWDLQEIMRVQLGWDVIARYEANHKKWILFQLLVYSKKLERGEWVPGFFNRVVQNVCPLLQMPTELWYPYTRLLKQKTCPYKAGVSFNARKCRTLGIHLLNSILFLARGKRKNLQYWKFCWFFPPAAIVHWGLENVLRDHYDQERQACPGVPDDGNDCFGSVI